MVVNGHTEGGSHDRSPEPEEYTYERAIQNYVNFTESRVRGKTLTSSSEMDSSRLTNGTFKKPSPPIPTKPRRGSCKIEEKLSELEQIKQKSISTTDLTENMRKPLSVPKVDILKRREMFEKSQGEETTLTKNRFSGDFSSSKNIRDRFSSLGKPSDDTQSSTKKFNRLSSEISVKDRLLHIEKQNLIESNPKKLNATNGNVVSNNKVKERLSTLQKAPVVELRPANFPNTSPVESASVTVKTTQKASTVEKETENTNTTVVSNNDEISNNNGDEIVNNKDHIGEKSSASPNGDIYDSKRQQHYRHRSLDSLDVDSSDGVGNEAFERVQSLEDLDFCRNYPASSVSGDTDREDSGIHTADVSSSVSQADDFESEYQHQPTILEEINKNPQLTSALIAKQIIQKNVSDPEIEVVALPEEQFSSGSFKLPLRLDCDPLPVIIESPSEPFPPESSSHNTFHNVTSSDCVNTNVVGEQCIVSLVKCGEGDQNSLLVNTTSLTLSTLPAQVLHDSRTGAVEICHKVDVSDLSTPLPKPEVSATAEYQLEKVKLFLTLFCICA